MYRKYDKMDDEGTAQSGTAPEEEILVEEAASSVTDSVEI